MAVPEMRSIVERLRIRQPLLGRLCDEAADRIEALEAALRECKHGAEYCDELGDIIDAALAPEQEK
jgi:hypothetical protein